MLIGVSIFLLHEFYNPYLATAHSHTPTCRHTRTPQQLYPHHLCTPTRRVPYTPLHTQQLYLHHLCTPIRTLPCTPLHTQLSHLHTHPSSFTRTTCAHPYTYLQISTNINSPQLSQSLFTNICKYPHSICHNPYNQNSILTILTIATVTILTIKIQSNRVDNKRI